ncbi:protein abrupt isoform X2 [Cherax quadricarinatus]|uniref:protein abrupt isoform X2 n=1 Tax=Cherax quadricarinatus TaxID=27406 RepID=UPI002379AF17|nr:protein abrupt-like isoform X2 [Cherax quadricarinatus]
MSEQCFCLRWNNYQSSVVGVLRSLLEEGQFVDVTLACDGRRLKAHKLMLSACSNFFRELLKENPSDHPIIFLRDVRFWELESIMDFIYNGQVNVMQDQLPGFIRTAEALQIKGLAAVNNNNNNIHAKPPDQRLFCGDIGRLQEPYLSGGEIGELHQPPPLKRPRRPPPSTHSFLPPRQENPSPVTRSPQEEIPNKPTIAATASQAVAKSQLPVSEPCKTDPTLGIAVQGTAVASTPAAQGSSYSAATSPKGTAVEKISSAAKSEDERTSTPDAESDTEYGSNDGSSLSMIENPKYVEWSPGETQSPVAINFNEGGYPVCKVCGKVFKHQGSLVAHYQVHQLRTKCPVCKKVLSRHYHMKVHLLTVHKVPDSEIEGLLRSQNIA